MKFPKLSDFPIMNTEIITRVLKDFKQVILSGPPGTSKSHWAKSIAQDDYFKVISLKFNSIHNSAISNLLVDM